MTTNIKKLRADFPIFHTKPEWAYLDTAATSQTPQVVLDAVGEYCCAYHASVHRGVYREAERATEVYEQARTDVAKFLHARFPDEIVFTSGATASSNMLVRMLEETLDLREGDEIVTTVSEHHASLIPLQELARRKSLTMVYLPLKKDYTLLYSEAEARITPRTKIVSVMLASNVLGTVNNVRRIATRAHEVGACVISDATAAVGHMPVDVARMGADFVYFSGHKMCGPTGVGVLYGKREMLATLPPSVYGGMMVDGVTFERASWALPPLRFEAGTPNISGVIGLGAAVHYLASHDLADAHKYIQALHALAVQELGKVQGVRIYTAPSRKNVGIVVFTVAGVHPHDVAQIAAEDGVAVRAGHHCAMPLHTTLGLEATVRASFFIYNTKHDVDMLVRSVRRAQAVFRAT